jgi:hypothetical protein
VTPATDDRAHVLNHRDTFAAFAHPGQVKPDGLGEEGLYHEGTRYLSFLLLDRDGRWPVFLLLRACLVLNTHQSQRPLLRTLMRMNRTAGTVGHGILCELCELDCRGHGIRVN